MKYYFIKNIELSTILLTNIPTLAARSLSLVWCGRYKD
jgi:hypothetical protein